jgi:hypothetical protein
MTTVTEQDALPQLARCSRCGYASETLLGDPCPSCGRGMGRSANPLDAGLNLILGYLNDLWRIITRPSVFFRRMPIRGGLAGPVAFALITHWVGSAISYLWKMLISGSVSGYVSELFKVAGDIADVDSPGRSAALYDLRDQFLHWAWGIGSVIVDPFITIFSILFTSFFVYLGARILVQPVKNGAPERIEYESALRIVCYGMSPAILAAIPLAGGILAPIFVAIVTIIGAREVYRIGTGRAVVVALFPKLLFLGIILMGLSLLAIFFLKVVVTQLFS